MDRYTSEETLPAITLDELLDALITADRAEQLKKADGGI